MSAQDQPASAPLVVPLVFVSIFFLFIGYVIAAAVCAVIFASNVPLSGLDMAQSSWLAWAHYIHPGPLFLAMLFFGAGLLNILTADVARGTLLVVFAAFSFVSSSNPIIFRYAALNGHAKIGCYVYESRECLAMLDVQDHTAPSMYQRPDRSNGYKHWAPWYEEARRGTPTPIVLPIMSPAFLILSAPFNMDRAEELNAMLDAQRAEVAAVKAKHNKAGQGGGS
jgi:hypothetical protein